MFGLLTAQTATPTRRMAESGSGHYGTLDGAFCTKGLTVGSKIATTQGWRPVETLTAGDAVMTFDNGVQRITAVTRMIQPASDIAPEISAPVIVPALALGNMDDMVLLPEQEIMIESDAAETLYGDPFALVRAKDLIGYRGISQDAGARPAEVITLHFAGDEILYMDGGAMTFCAADVPGTPTLDFLKNPYIPAPYTIFKGREARKLVAAMSHLDAHSQRREAAMAAYV